MKSRFGWRIGGGAVAFALLGALVGRQGTAAQERPGRWTPELSIQIKRVGAVRASSDGKRVVYTVTGPVMTADRSENVSQIWLAGVDGRNPVQLTFHDKGASDPQWSPDGKYIAFLSTRSGKSNLYRMRLDGGEPEALTDGKRGVTSYQWSPDGQSLAVVMTDPSTDEEEKGVKGRDDAKWVEENFKFQRLHVIPAAADAQDRREPRVLTAGSLHVADFDWSPDGKAIAFGHTKTPRVNDWPTGDVSVVDVASGQLRPLAATPAAEADPHYSPDGSRVAMTVNVDPPRWIRQVRLQVVPTTGGTPRSLPPTHDEVPDLVGWSKDGNQLYVTESRGTLNRLYAMGLNGGGIVELNSGNDLLGTVSLNDSRTMFGFSQETSDRPQEAYVSPVGKFAAAQVSHANDGRPDLPTGKTEVIRWKGKDGLEIEGLLTTPVGYQSGLRVPLLLNVHGGPSGVFTQGCVAGPSIYPIAAFAARGYAVLRPNPRGSSGYGHKFRGANYRDWGGGDYQDLMAGVDRVIKMGVADPERLGVMGWSYGGYMTSWIITQTRRFKAASIGAPVTNLVSFTGTADIPGFLPSYFGAQYWEEFDLYRAHSPIAQVKGVTTPALIQHGEADERVPIGQGYELYNALKTQGVPVRMLTLPRQPHGPREPKMLLKVMNTNLEWFEKYIPVTSAGG